MHQILRKIHFVLQIRFWQKLCFQKIIFWSFLQRNKSNFSNLCFLLWNGYEKEIGIQTVFESKSFDTSVSCNQIFTTRQFYNEKIYNVSHFETTLSQRITFASRIDFIKSNTVAKLVFENCPFTSWKRQSFCFRAFLKSLALKNNEIRKNFP